MPRSNRTVEARATKVRTLLAAGALAGLGPVALTVGTIASAELAARILLAEQDHLKTLTEHTGYRPSVERWGRLDGDLRLLLLAQDDRRDGATTGANGGARSPIAMARIGPAPRIER